MAASPSPISDDPFPIGSMLGDRYRIEAVLGSGGMGRVYRAAHTEVGTPVAIKVLHADLTRNREASQRFKREMLASRRLAHPNIVGFTEGGVLDDGACYLVMEMLEGESLGDRLAREAQIPWREAVEILRGVLHGLDHAHRRNVVHRDIKPDNVYLAHKHGDLAIKILDFGIAKFVAGDPDDPALTRAGLTVGTPAYLSPEQAVGGQITPASDLYSASVVMYEMLAGQAPFEDKDPLVMLGAHVSRPPPRFADIAPGVEIPAELEDIVLHGLRKAPADRIGTAARYLARLDEHWPPRRPAPRIETAQDTGPEAGPEIDAAFDAIRLGTAPPDATAPAGARSSRSGARARTLGSATPSPDSSAVRATSPRGVGRALSVEMMPLPRAARVMSLAEVNEPIPLTWIVRSGVLIGLLIIAAIALAIGAHCRGGEPSAPPASSAAPAAAPPSAVPPSGAAPSAPGRDDDAAPAPAAAPPSEPATARPTPAGKPAPGKPPPGKSPHRPR